MRVRFNADLPGEWTAGARVVMAVGSADVALLEITGATLPESGLRPPRYGAIPDADLVLPCSAMGFPRFKVRTRHMRRLDDGSPSQYRDSCHATGTVSVLSNRRAGTLELSVGAPGTDPEPDRSPWEGMSGAAVWCGDVLVGLVTEHHRADGLGRIAAGRVDRWYSLMDDAQLGLLQRLAGAPGDSAGLVRSDGSSAGPATAAPAPLAALPSDLPLRELDGLVGALIQVPSVRDATSLGLILDSVRPEVAANSPRHPALRVDLIGIIRTCLRYPGALDQLLETVRLLEGGSAQAGLVDQEAAKLARRHPHA